MLYIQSTLGDSNVPTKPNRAGVKPAPRGDSSTRSVGAGFIPAREEPGVGLRLCVGVSQFRWPLIWGAHADSTGVPRCGATGNGSKRAIFRPPRRGHLPGAGAPFGSSLSGPHRRRHPTERGSAARPQHLLQQTYAHHKAGTDGPSASRWRSAHIDVLVGRRLRSCSVTVGRFSTSIYRSKSPG